jgi:ATP synthase protein I
VGALGGLVYLRLLNKSVDGFGGGLGGAVSQPRLLIPVILALGYNR